MPSMFRSMRGALQSHWPEYLMEAAGLALFMISGCLFATLLQHPGSFLRQGIDPSVVRRALMGIAMGATAIGLIYSPWGRRSGAHLNPGVTLTFLRLGKVAPTDAFFYVAAQFVGGAAGVFLMNMILGNLLADPRVNHVATVPGVAGVGVAFVAETVISFALMLVVLMTSNHRRLSRYTGIFAGFLVASFILVEAPLSGMSMNPARTFASAVSAWLWTGLWIYFTAPLLGMLLAAQLYLGCWGAHAVFCAKLNHHGRARCIFHCRIEELEGAAASSVVGSPREGVLHVHGSDRALQQKPYKSRREGSVSRNGQQRPESRRTGRK